MKKNAEYRELQGKSKSEVQLLLGDEFNFFPSSTWTYTISKTWYGREKVLLLHFEKDTVKKVTIKNRYWKW